MLSKEETMQEDPHPSHPDGTASQEPLAPTATEKKISRREVVVGGGIAGVGLGLFGLPGSAFARPQRNAVAARKA